MKIPTPETIELWGGTLCLDLANSADWDAHGDEVEPEHNDVLLSAEMLARWARRLGVLAEDGRGRSPTTSCIAYATCAPRSTRPSRRSRQAPIPIRRPAAAARERRGGDGRGRARAGRRRVALDVAGR